MKSALELTCANVIAFDDCDVSSSLGTRLVKITTDQKLAFSRLS